MSSHDLLQELSLLIDFEVRRNKRKVIVLVPSRLSSLFLTDSLKKTFSDSTSSIQVLPFLGKQSMCIQAEASVFHSMICEELGCPLKQSTRKMPAKLLRKLALKIVHSSSEKTKQILSSTGFCPYYLQFKLARRSDVIVATHGFASPSGIMFLCHILGISLHQVCVILAMPELVLRNKEITVSFALLKELDSLFPNAEITDLLLVPRFTLLPLPVDPLVFLALKHRILRAQSVATPRNSLLDQISSLESAIDFDEPYVFLSNDLLYIAEGNPWRPLDRLDSMVSVQKLFSSYMDVNLRAFKNSEKTITSPARTDVRIHFVQLPSDFSIFSNYSVNSHRIFRLLYFLLRNEFPQLIILPTESIMDQIESEFSQCINSRRLMNSHLSDFDLIKAMRNLFSLRKTLLLLNLDKIHQSLAFMNPDFLAEHPFTSTSIVQIGKPVIVYSPVQEYLMQRWDLLLGPHTRQQYEYSLAQISLLLNQEFARRVGASAIVVFDTSVEWLPKELPIIYHRSVDFFLKAFFPGS